MSLIIKTKSAPAYELDETSTITYLRVDEHILNLLAQGTIHPYLMQQVTSSQALIAGGVQEFIRQSRKKK